MELTRGLAVLATLVVYKVALVAIGVWASRRTRDPSDFFLGGRQLGALVAWFLCRPFPPVDLVQGAGGLEQDHLSAQVDAG